MGKVSVYPNPPPLNILRKIQFSSTMKVFILVALVGAVSALPLADHHDGKHHKEHEGVRALPEGPLRIERRANPPPPPKYAPAPKPYGKPEKEFPPQPYQFEYGVADSYSGSKFQAAETQDGEGTVLGSYTVNLPDGRTQIVTYKADHYGGFVADVKYEGEAVYPPEPAEGYGANKYVAQGKGYGPPPPRYAPA